MKNFFASWKTSSAGLLMIIGAIVAMIYTKPLDQTTLMATVSAVVGGIGLLFAKDGNVTGGTKQQ